jgi:hypothetical protein
LCGLSAALGSSSDSTMVALSAAVFSIGAMAIATGTYIKARALPVVAKSSENAPAARRRTRGGCQLCGTDVPVIHCRVHQLQLCPACLTQHYDPRSCSFVPLNRRMGTKPRAVGKATGA